MTNSQVINQQYNEPTSPLVSSRLVLSTTFLVVFIIIAALGLADSIYLTTEHYMNSIPPCTLSRCEIVLTSKYSSVLGVPVSLFGALYYAFVMVLTVLYMQEDKEARLAGKSNKLIVIALVATHLGFAASLYFTYLQAFVINAWCQYCLMSGVTSTVLWVMGRVGLRKRA